jgi:nickel/cobalt exporter
MFHALSPGHGKTMVAAYMAGAGGQPWDAVILGITVTFTHVFVVIVLGVAALAAQSYFIPERITPVLEIVASLLVLGTGAWLTVDRARSLTRASA